MAIFPDDAVSFAVKDRQKRIEWYRRNMSKSRLGYNLCLGITIVAGGLTPLLVLVQQTYPEVGPLPVGISSVVAGIAAALNAGFRHREQWARFAVTAAALDSDLVMFRAKVGEDYGPHVDESQRLATFLLRTQRIELAETEEWRLPPAQSTSDKSP